jgi:hypothetical protein
MAPGFFVSFAGLVGMAAFGPTMFLVGDVHIRCCGNGGLWFRPYGDSLFYKRLKKEAKNARPKRTAPR